MTGSLLIGEAEANGVILPVYASSKVVDRAIRVDFRYSGHDDSADRSLMLLAMVSEALSKGKTSFGHSVSDRSWRGNPDNIESERISLSVSVGRSSITVDVEVRTIEKADPRFKEIAAQALRTLKKYECRRDV